MLKVDADYHSTPVACDSLHRITFNSPLPNPNRPGKTVEATL
ncbi:hypothetical protein SP21_15 [Salmonella phage 21]|nr:hypothetical protein SP21_15 [Salmonella phage 21]